MSNSEIVDFYLRSSSELSELLNEMNADVDECNLLLSDLDHFLEIEELTPEQTANLTLRRKEILSRRRRAKDYVYVIDQILPKQIEGRTTQDRYEFAVNKLGERVYSPRRISLDEAVKEI